MTRLRIEGPLARDEFPALRLRDVQLFGASRNFFFELDTQGLALRGTQDDGETQRGVRFSQQEEIRQLVEERLALATTDHERGLLVTARDELLACYP